MHIPTVAVDNLGPGSSISHVFEFVYLDNHLNIQFFLKINFIFLHVWICKQDPNFAKLMSLQSGEIETIQDFVSETKLEKDQ